MVVVKVSIVISHLPFAYNLNVTLITTLDRHPVNEGIIADWMEAGLGFRFTTRMVNQHRMEEGRKIIGRSASTNHFDRMYPVLTKVSKCYQCNSNNIKWKQDRHNQCKQFLIMFIDITFEEITKEYQEQVIPDWFNPSLLPSISPD